MIGKISAGYDDGCIMVEKNTEEAKTEPELHRGTGKESTAEKSTEMVKDLETKLNEEVAAEQLIVMKKQEEKINELEKKTQE